MKWLRGMKSGGSEPMAYGFVVLKGMCEEEVEEFGETSFLNPIPCGLIGAICKGVGESSRVLVNFFSKVPVISS